MLIDILKLEKSLEKDMDYINSDKLIFICASPAGSGYRLGRIVACLDNVYWYATKGNGLYPWSVVRKDPNKVSSDAMKVKGRRISKFHFDRKTNTGVIPLVGERVEQFWNKEDLDYYYNTIWPNLMSAAGADKIINQKQLLTWVIHDSPQQILQRFPNAKVINLIDDDILEIAKRYMSTTALFPIKIENKDIKPAYKNKYAQLLDDLEKINQNPTYRDHWAWITHGIGFYSDDLKEEYFLYVLNNLQAIDAEKKLYNPNCLNVSWRNFDIGEIIKFCSANSIVEEYKDLLF
jgi:hypothetical protein